MSAAPRKAAPRLARPAARYWKGKAPKGVDATASDSDDSDGEEGHEVGEEGDVLIRDVDGDEEEDVDGLEVKKSSVAMGKARAGINVALRDVNISKEGRVIVAGKAEVGRTEAELEEDEEEEDQGEEAEEEGEESEESSEEESEEEPPKPQFRPVFVPKRGRVTVAEEAALAQDTEEAAKRKEAEAEERRKQSHNMVAESIRRELAEKEKEAEVPDVDDTDGLDPEGEFEAWRLRELARIKRDKEEELRRETEREEIERRRALPEEQRLKEDMEHAEKSRAEKPKGQQKFLQKYWHKGAFRQACLFSDEEILKRHDYTEATESTVDVSLLPKVMQVKNFGKRSRTKYTHLLDQDTTAPTGGCGGTAPVKSGGTSTAGGGCFLCGGPHLKKDCPQNQDIPPNRIGTGANSTLSGTRQWGPRRNGEDGERRGSWKERDDGDEAVVTVTEEDETVDTPGTENGIGTVVDDGTLNASGSGTPRGGTMTAKDDLPLAGTVRKMNGGMGGDGRESGQRIMPETRNGGGLLSMPSFWFLWAMIVVFFHSYTSTTSQPGIRAITAPFVPAHLHHPQPRTLSATYSRQRRDEHPNTQISSILTRSLLRWHPNLPYPFDLATQNMTRRKVKVAVVGSGLAGLTAAYRIAKTPCMGDVEFEVHVFEKSNAIFARLSSQRVAASARLVRNWRSHTAQLAEMNSESIAASLGMDSHSVNVTLPGQDSTTEKRIDVPMRSFQGGMYTNPKPPVQHTELISGYYPQLIALYEHLGVRFRQADFTYSFATVSSAVSTLQNADASNRNITTFMIYDGASGRNGLSVPASYFPSSHAASRTLWDTCFAYAAYAISGLVVLLFSLRMALLSLPIRTTNPPSLGSILLSINPGGLLKNPARMRIPRYMLPIPVRPPPHTTFRDWVRLTTPQSALSKWVGLDKCWVEFANDILIPLFSAVCTIPEESVWEHPVEELLDYCYLTIGTHHYVVQDGVRDVVERISAPLKRENIHLASPIVSLVHTNFSALSDHPFAKIDIHCTNNTVFPAFDHVIFATQANQASRILKTYLDSIPEDSASATNRHRDLVEQQIACLASFQYSSNIVVNHTDPTLMPDAQTDRRDLNLMMTHASFRAPGPITLVKKALDDTPVSATMPPTFVMATHVLPGTHQLVYQTTNPIVQIEEESVLSVARLERAFVTVSSKNALRGLWREGEQKDKVALEEERGTLRWGCAAVARGSLGSLQGAGGRYDAERFPGVWFCGSYAYGGIPLLEGCVVSARLVVEEGLWVSEGVDWRTESGILLT
ncbi:splicing factor, Prp19-binding domain-containing protein [Cytidiella melzeri]|nr:splicing factor, Prp19-binding domain-containing protein [Cytidiella melzeri]